jgi:YVTN family beta-propeller protein
VTNEIYVANGGSNNVTVINGYDNTTTTVDVGLAPGAISVNPISNEIYVANYSGNSVSVIDGGTNTTITTIAAGSSPYAVAVNPVTNKIYVPNYNSNNVTVIDGITNFASNVAVGNGPVAVAVNPITNEIYVANQADGTVTVIDEQPVQPVPLVTTIQPLPWNWTSNPTPVFNFTAASTFSPQATTPDNLLYQIDTWQGPWQPASNQNNSVFTATAPALQPGLHTLYAYATDGQEGTATITGVQPNPLVGSIAAYSFLVAPKLPLAMPVLTVNGGTFVYNGKPHTATCKATGIGAVAVSGTCSFTYNGNTNAPTEAGTYIVVAVFSSKNGSYTSAEAAGTLTINPALPIVKVTGTPVVYNGLGQSATCTATGVGETVIAGSCQFTFDGSTSLPINVGTYSVTASFTSADADYENASGSGIFRITPAPVTITANNAIFVQGFTFPTLSVSYTGLVDGQTAAELQGTLKITTTGKTTSPLGTYPITASGLTSTNYKITYVKGTLTVTGPGPAVSNYLIQNVNSGLVLGVLGASMTEGASIVQWTNDGSPDQVWILNQLPSGAYVISDTNSGYVIGVLGASLSAGASLVQWQSNGSPDQDWYFIANGSNWIIVDANSQMNLDVSNASIGAQAIQSPSDGSSSQIWTLIPIQ